MNDTALTVECVERWRLHRRSLNNESVIVSNTGDDPFRRSQLAMYCPSRKPQLLGREMGKHIVEGRHDIESLMAYLLQRSYVGDMELDREMSFLCLAFRTSYRLDA